MAKWTAQPVAVVLACVFLILLASTVAVRVARRRNHGRDFGEVEARIHTWWAIAVALSAALALGRLVTLSFLGMLSFLALKEYYSLIPTRRADRRVLFYAYVAIIAQYYWIASAQYGLFSIFVPVYVFLLLPVRMVITGNTSGFLAALGTLYWGLMTTVYSLSHLGFLLWLPRDGSGTGLLLFVLVLTQANDVFQYLWGKSIGGRKIIPAVSPGKTWAGFLGGVVSTVALSFVLAPYLTPLIPMHTLWIGLIISVSGFFGDVTISAVKRDLHVKDSGTLLPGHGGILDRVDSLTFTAPLFFHFMRFFYY